MLALLGNIDLNTNTAAALDDWNQILALAKKSGDQKWENRAKGELGLIAGVNGDIGTAAFALYSAMGKAEQIGDVAAHINFATWLGNGMAINGMADRSVKVIDQAVDLARKSGYTSVPLQLSIAKIRALANLPDPQTDQSRDAVKRLIAETLLQAQKEHVLGAQTELLNEAGQIATGKMIFLGREGLRQAAEVSKTAGLPREDAEAYLHLSQFYRATNQPAKASAAIDQGIQPSNEWRRPMIFHSSLPKRRKWKMRSGMHAADASFQRATDLVEGLLVNAPSSQVKSAMIGALSKIYSAIFIWHGIVSTMRRMRSRSSKVPVVAPYAIRFVRETIGSAIKSQTPGKTEITRFQRSLMHDQLNNAQTRRCWTNWTPLTSR